MPRLILASSSPRRYELLAAMGYVPDIILSPDIDETLKKQETPGQYVKRLAYEKAAVVASEYPDDVVLAGDTTVIVGKRILGKPESKEEAAKFLTLLSGRQHRVYTAVAVAHKSKTKVRLVQTKLKVKKLSKAEITFHTESKQWDGKAGGYMILGIFGAYVKNINGSLSSVVGLPMLEASNLLASFGIFQHNTNGHGYSIPIL